MIIISRFSPEHSDITFRSSLGVPHRFGYVGRPKLDHDGVRVTINYHCVEVVPIPFLVLFLNTLLCLIDHLTTEGRNGRGDLETSQLANGSTGKAVDGVGADFQG